MNKQDAINLLGGSVTAAAAAMRISHSAVSQWPDVLPDRLVDRVQAALYRMNSVSTDGGQPEGGTNDRNA
jgi:hypothetical protein